MEFFPAHHPCLLHSLPTMAAVSDAQGKKFLGVTFVNYPRADYLTFCDKPPPSGTVDPTFNSTVLISHDLADRFAVSWPNAKLLHVDDPRAVFIDTLAYLQHNSLLGSSSLLPKAPAVSANVKIGTSVIIEPGVQVDDHVSIGSGTVIHAGTWLKRGSIIGDNCTIGGIGINAYAGKDGLRRGFPHTAGVIIGENANIGAGCVVVRGILSSTRIGACSTIGNLCNVGHGVEIGENVWISIGTMIGGHTRIAAFATIAMGCTIRDNIDIGTQANIGMGSVVTKQVSDGASVFGNPARSVPIMKAGPAR